MVGAILVKITNDRKDDGHFPQMFYRKLSKIYHQYILFEFVILALIMHALKNGKGSEDANIIEFSAKDVILFIGHVTEVFTSYKNSTANLLKTTAVLLTRTTT